MCQTGSMHTPSRGARQNHPGTDWPRKPVCVAARFCCRVFLGDVGAMVLEVAKRVVRPCREKQDVREGWTFLHFVLTVAWKRFHVHRTARSLRGDNGE